MQEIAVTSISLNTHAVMNKDQMAIHSKATSTMNNVKETAARFQKLDNVENVDTDPTDSVVTISPEKPAALPLTPKEQIAEKMGIDVAKASTFGMTQANEKGEVTDAMFMTTKGDKEETFQYAKLQDGNEVYHGPTPDGYAVIKENRGTGTLFMATSEQPMTEQFQAALSADFQTPEAANDPSKRETQTFGGALKQFADTSSQRAGTANQYRQQKLDAAKGLWNAARNGLKSVFG